MYVMQIEMKQLLQNLAVIGVIGFGQLNTLRYVKTT